MEYLVLSGDIMAQKVYFLILCNTHNLFYYTVVSSQQIEVYRVKTMDMGKIPMKNVVN